MHFLLAANGLHKEFAKQCVKSLDALGYPWTMFDLGGLGFGRSYTVNDQLFQSQGNYKSVFTKRPTRGLHKPQIIAQFLSDQFSKGQVELVVYLDVDTFVRQHISEIEGDYDIGVTVRKPREWKRHGKVNAGVLFVRPTIQTRTFLRKWITETKRIGNDQEALNLLLKSQPCKIGEFPTNIYNWYYFPEPPPSHVKILHFKASAPNDLILRRQAWKSACERQK